MGTWTPTTASALLASLGFVPYASLYVEALASLLTVEYATKLMPSCS